MFPVSIRSVVSGLVPAACLLTGSLAGLGAVQPAQADIGICRSDPLVLLSNGVRVSLTDVVGDPASDVQHISYLLRAPVGTTIQTVLYPGDRTSSEALTFVADQGPHSYLAGTTVSTVWNRTAPVTFTATVQLPGQADNLEGAASGTAGQTLTVPLG
jgi:hypothetical protein